MIPRVAQLGRSFIGAGQYYLHDVRPKTGEPRKAAATYYLADKDAPTAQRVAFAETLNLPTKDPHKGMKVMAWTAEHASDIRQVAVAAAAKAAGMTYDAYVRQENPFRGRKGTQCVYAYSLSFHPDQGAPTRAEMIAAAKETLDILEMKDHQAVLVSHSDRAHPHIHVIVNRVHPKTGRYADYSRDRLKLSAWAEGYERRTGRVLCWERVHNNKERSRGGFVKHEAVPRADHEWWQKHKDMTPEAIRAARAKSQADDKAALLEERKARGARLAIWAEKTLAPDITRLRSEIARLEATLAVFNEKARPQGFMKALSFTLKKVAAKVFGHEKRAKGLLPRLKASRASLDARAKLEIDKLTAWQTGAETALLRRQAVETTRDEERITRLIEGRKARETGEEGRSAFNAQGRPATAGVARPPKEVQIEKPGDAAASLEVAAEKTPSKERYRNRNRNRDRTRQKDKGFEKD